MNTALFLALLSIVNIGLLFILQWYVVIKLGTGIATDALFVAFSLPQLVTNVIANSLMQVLVPILSITNDINFRQHVWGLMFIFGGIFLLLTIILIAAADWWVPITIPGFNDNATKLAINLTKIQLLSLIFNAILGIQWAAWYAQKRFIRVEVAALLGNIVGLILLVWQLPKIGVTAATLAFNTRVVMQFLLLLPGLGIFVWPQQPYILFMQVWKKLSPLLLGTAYYKTDVFVDRWLLSYSLNGNLSLYYLAQQVYAALHYVLNKSVIAPLVPTLSHHYKNKEMIAFHNLYQKYIQHIGLLLIVAYIVFIFIGESLFFVLLTGYSSFTPTAIKTLWFIMVCLGGLLVGSVLGEITAYAFYAQGNTIIPTKISAVCFSIQLPVKIIAFFQFGLVGLALVSSVYFLANFILQLYFLKFNYDSFPKR